eukprot:TRINITY_DN4330_c0_g1_i4.p1 TRINITY_DN4330_c0_g1~~TRINITY_DN4330_c0_g1_i4.p1  ORF type:complete len:354 (-),score=49.84 TRINITY_DN4330_c0_g1_i4:188-1249(-)
MLSARRLLGRRLSLDRFPSRVALVEVSPRDGLQNEATLVPTRSKMELVTRLAPLGFRSIEVTSFVSAKWVPQMGDGTELYTEVVARSKSDPAFAAPGTTFSTLVPNLRGLDGALAVGCDDISIFGAASEAFTAKNINCTIAESLERFAEVCKVAKENSLRVRGYVSCALHCPYTGPTSPKEVARVAERLLDMGCYEVSIGDTTGAGGAGGVHRLMKELVGPVATADKFALHFHDTYGMAISNILAGMSHGVAVIDASVGGIGGCPYARGATGNVATEDVIYLLNDLGIDCGVDLEKAADAGKFITGLCGKRTRNEGWGRWASRNGECGEERGMESVEKKEDWRMWSRKRNVVY